MNAPSAVTSTTSSLGAPPKLRFGVAAIAIAASALAGMKTHCWDLIDTDLVVLGTMVVLQGVIALASFVSALVACLRTDFRRAAMEVVTGIAMLCVVPLAVGAFVVSTPRCAALEEGS